jgi:iron complex outermembrane receptor protein
MPTLAGRMLRRPGMFAAVLALLSLLTGSAAWAQGRVVTGRVTAQEDGSALPGVSVVVKGTTTGTATDGSGNYSVTVPGNETTLVYSFIGYVSQEVVVSTQTTVDVVMAPDVTALTEVVVVGYGTQKKEDLTGAVTAISAKDFNPGQITTPDQLITGKVAGVQITPAGGAPGAASRIRIRGGSSLNASNDPLVVIDGVPVDNTEVKGAANALAMINPNDIESFNILKDASATAIYGSRASNGVIIITTKKGKAGDRLRVEFGSLLSLSTIRNTIDVLNADEFRRVVEERATPTQQALLGTDRSINTDWQDQIFRSAWGTDNNLSLTGAYKSLPFRLSFGYLDQSGILKTSNFQRTSGSLSLNPSFLKDHLRVNLNLKGSIANSRFADVAAIGAAIAFDPTQPVYAPNNFGGYFEYAEAPDNAGVVRPRGLAPRNPLSTLEQRRDDSRVARSIGNLQFDYKFHFLPELRANLNLGYDVSDGEGSVDQPATLAAVFNQGGSIAPYAQTKTNKLLDFYLNYVKELPGISSRLDVMAGYSYQDFEREEPSFPVLTSEGSVFTPANPFPFQTQNTLIGFFGRLNYAFKDRYLLTANIRRDGSSRFGEGNKWGTFPSVALAWKLNEEGFLKGTNIFSDLKVRVGYGVTGQQDIGGDYPYLARYTNSTSTAQYQLGGQFYNLLRPEGYDPNIKWEETTTWNAGLDYGFLNGRISGTLDYYFKQTKDLLAVIPVPAGSNLTNLLLTNVGNIENQGLEAALNFNVINTERLRWDVGGNATYNTSKITRLSKVQDEDAVGVLVGGISGATGGTIQVHTVGYRPNAFYVYKQVYDESGQPIEGLYADLNGDGAVNDRDLYRYKNPEPRVFFGLNSQVSYDKWSLGFVARGNLGNYVYNNIQSNSAYANLTTPGFLTNLNRNVLATNFEQRQLYSDYYLENASFLRMENITLGYNFGQVLNEKVSLRLSANVQNAFVITKYTGLDPEVVSAPSATTPSFAGIDNNFYPRPRIFSFGVNVGF